MKRRNFDKMKFLPIKSKIKKNEMKKVITNHYLNSKIRSQNSFNYSSKLNYNNFF